jgi:serine/threonine protein kinase
MTDPETEPISVEFDTLISNRYRLGELLGTGGSASVFKAVDVQTGLTVALKMLHPHLSQSESTRAAFFAEAAAAQPLRHENIVGVLGTGVHDTGDEPLAWIALEFAPGMSLAELIEIRGRLTPVESLAVASGLLAALEASHAIGLIHRDISPANVMVEPDATGSVISVGVRLLDFGLADAAGKTTRGVDILRSVPVDDDDTAGVSGVLGSANYMSPEQARGLPVDERGDIYQLGGVLYFCLTGQRPYARATTTAVMRAHLQTPPPVPSVITPGLGRELDRLVVKAMMKDPGSRFASAHVMNVAVTELRAVILDPVTAGLERTRILQTPKSGTTVVSAKPFVEGPAAAYARDPIFMPARRARLGPLTVALLAMLAIGGGAWGIISSQTPASDSAASVPILIVTPSPSATISITATAPAATALAPSTVPEIGRSTLDAARAALTAAGFTIGSITLVPSSQAANVILASLPAGGQTAPRDSAVNLTIASGSNAVPLVVGLDSNSAVAAVRAAGFVALLTSHQDETKLGRALGTEPAAGTFQPLGSRVTVVVSEPTAVQQTSTPTPLPMSGSTPRPTPSVAPTPAN